MLLKDIQREINKDKQGYIKEVNRIIKIDKLTLKLEELMKLKESILKRIELEYSFEHFKNINNIINFKDELIENYPSIFHLLDILFDEIVKLTPDGWVINYGNGVEDVEIDAVVVHLRAIIEECILRLKTDIKQDIKELKIKGDE